ncbi:DUF551 domain-containing protein [Klebsiella pneumoniae]
MTKSTITREWLQQTIAELESVRDEIPFGIDTNSELELAAFKMALAAMDSEPVAWINGCNKSVPAALRYLAESPRPIGGESSFNTAHLYQLAREIELMSEAPLYRHAQQPVVPDEMLCEFYEVANWPDLVRELVKHVEQLQDSAKRNVKPWEDTFPETLLPAYIDRIKQADDACLAAMLQAGNCRENANSSTNNFRKISETSTNSPVIPDAWIPVSEQMPEDGQHIIIFCDGAFVLFAQCRDGEFFDIVRDREEFFETTSRCVTHWMPLPNPPKEEK